jgi:diguanylate cyclase (GGDEF)-like protein
VSEVAPTLAVYAVHHDAWMVAASVLLSVFVAFVAFDLAGRARSSDAAIARGWLFGGGAMMGTSTWAMHFLGLLGLRLPVPLGFEAGWTFVSWVAALWVAIAALWVASRASLTRRRWWLSTLALGLGACAMHVASVQAVHLEPGVRWSLPHVAAFVVCSFGGAALGIWLVFRLRQAQVPRKRLAQLGAAVLLGGAMALMSRVGLAAVQFPVGAVSLAVNALSVRELGALVGVSAFVLTTVTLLTSLLDARMQSKTYKLAASLRQANAKLQRIAYRDPLTQLPNRLVLEDRLDRASARSQRDGTRIALLFIDLDGFKPVNDSFGHSVGDALLRDVGERLRGVARPSDTLARVGGDEFLLLLDGQPDRATAAEMAQHIRDAIEAPFTLGQREVRLSCSIGIVLFPEHGPRAKLIANADAAMYAAKRSGGSAHCFFEPHMDACIGEQVDLQRDLRVALERGDLMLHYQPKIHSHSRQVSGAEALLRWHHPTRGLVGPAEFIPIAERFGLIGMLGNWVIDEACRQIAAWRTQGLRLRVAINLSVHQLRQPDLEARIREALRRHAVDPALVTFEITESVAMEDTASSMRAFEQLAAIGVQLAIDDFGTGYSSLSYLRKLPARQLKIDRSFVQDLDKSPDARAIVEAVVRLAHALGLLVVAEGVETERQLEVLVELGCDEFQGFLFARPMPAQSITLWALENEAETAAGAEPPLSFRDSLYAGDGHTGQGALLH